ncbi:MAG TPA: FAD-dependent oxidoreductase [Candidatus Binatia bacterium]|nr:FAD-dependent oxidoreductase [Candidatus Binatia bacterium]
MRPAATADVVIVGADLAGLVAGAILTRHGRRVVVLEHADAVGGRGGAVRTPDGFWIDFGHRDAHGVGDCEFPWHYGVEAAREAGVEVAVRAIARPLRVHRLADGSVLDGGDWSAGGFLAAARDFFECPADGIEELTAVLARLAGADAAQVEAALPVRLGAWVEAHVRHPGVRRALLLMAAVIFHPRPADASAGRLMQFFQTPKGAPHIADDAEAGGMQGLMEPWARAIRARGGEIALGWKPVEIVVDGGRVHGAVAVDRANLVREVQAPVAVCTYPVWELFDLIDARRFPPGFVAAAEALARYRADLIGWQAGLRRLPTVRATGRPDDHAGWNRFLLGAAGERRYAGGYHLPSLTSRRAAPPGKHLLSWVMARFFDGGTTAGPPWTAARAHLDAAIAYLRRYYADLDDCIEWSAYQYVTAPQSMSWAWAPLERHGLTVPGIEGLLLASATLEAPAAIVDVSAYAGLAAAHAVLSA